jgi:hypothetical protein
MCSSAVAGRVCACVVRLVVGGCAGDLHGARRAGEEGGDFLPSGRLVDGPSGAAAGVSAAATRHHPRRHEHLTRWRESSPHAVITVQAAR